MKLLIINPTNIAEYYFNQEDAQAIISRCGAAGKQWSQNLVGFFISTLNNEHYLAINVKDNDGTIESMEYVNIDTNKPEFVISSEWVSNLTKNGSSTEINLAEFEPILAEILIAPVRARRWEVYPQVNTIHQLVH